ncbi:MAG: PilZ domain-containing protein, partial [Bdellovibrionales bacterium]
SMDQKKANNGRRRVPRRAFDAPVGMLLHGDYKMERAFQVGEGGMMICSTHPIEVGIQTVLSFFLTSGSLIIVRGVVRSVVPAQGKFPERYGIEFLNLGFQYKREIRNFVAAATRVDGPIAL